MANNNTENRYGNLLKNVMDNKEDRDCSGRIFVYKKRHRVKAKTDTEIS